MSMIPLREIGAKGIAPDQPAWDLPHTMAHVAFNCRIVAGKLVSSNGYQMVDVRSNDESLQINGATSNITPYKVGGWNTDSIAVWAIVGLPDGQTDYRIWIYDGNDLREAGAGYTTDDFTFNPLNTWLLAHNPDHPAQIVDGIGGNFIDLPGWATYVDGVNWRAGNVVPFGPFLVAGPIIGPIAKDFTIAWSDEIPPDIVNTGDISWAATPTTLAGENVLDPRAGKIITMLPLGQQLIIYCANAVWSMTFTGGPLVFAFRQLFTDDGILNKNCVVAINDNTHMVIGKNNIYTHNGTSKQFPAESRIKNFFYGEIRNVDNVRLHAQRWRNEVIVQYDIAEDLSPLSRAIVYNYIYDAWTMLELPALSDMSEAPLPTDFESWEEHLEEWGDNLDPWREYFAKGLDISVTCSPVHKKIYRDGIGTRYDEDAIISILRLERMDLDHVIEGKTTDRFMTIRRIYPQMRGIGCVRFSLVGYERPAPREAYDISTTEGDGIEYDIGVGYKVDKLITGRYLNLEIRTVQDKPDSYWMVSGLDLDLLPQTYRE